MSTFRDKRPVDELSIEELERILAIRRREARQMQVEKMRRAGRTIDPLPPGASLTVPPAPKPESTSPAVVTDANAGRIQLHAAKAMEAPQFEDALDADERSDANPPPPVYTIEAVSQASLRRRRIYDRILLLIEIAAVVGIVLIAINLVSAIQMLEQETAAAQSLAEEQRRAGIPTLAPTPTLRLENFILPGGHTVQNGLPVFNYAEVPAHLLPLVESQWIAPNISRPPPTAETALTLTIPALNLNQAIVQGVDWAALQQGVGQLVNGVNPGDPIGNVVLAAHNDIYGQIFRHLDQLEPGDQFQIQTQSNSYTYTVTEIRIVEPTDVSVLASRGTATATLISCYPYQVNTQRIIVFADRVN
ncbi:MAG: sortase [Candidatus Flexifilum sp.]|jgi:sortase A